MTKLATLLDPDALSARLPAGFGAGVEPWIEAAGRLRDLGHGSRTEATALFVPGRIEVLGKHTDYAGGRSLITATEQGFYLAVAARSDAELHLHDLGRDRRTILDLAGDLASQAGDWTSYPATVARRARRDFSLELGGADVVFTSTLPAAAGMSSSSALVVATWMALAAVNALENTDAYRRAITGREDLAGYLGAVEAGSAFGGFGTGGGVGTFGGSEDHTAILCCQAGHISQYSYAPVRHERTIVLPPDHLFAVALSGLHAKKTGKAKDDYNRASLLAAELAAAGREETGGTEPHLGALLAGGANGLGRLERALGRSIKRSFPVADLERRLEHFRIESDEIVPAAARALEHGEIAAFGAQVHRSHRLAERLLANQTPETSFLAVTARELGAGAASPFGAGFGGAVWALIRSADRERFSERWRRLYAEEFPERRTACRVVTTHAGPAAFALGSRPAGPTP